MPSRRAHPLAVIHGLLLVTFSTAAIAQPKPLRRDGPPPPAHSDDFQVVALFDFRRGDAHGWKPEHHLTPFDLTGGILRTQATGPDAHLSVSGLDLPADRISDVEFCMRSNRSGPTQVYFATSDSPNPAAHPVPVAQCRGDGRWRTYRVRLAGLKGFRGRLTMLRLDPVQTAPDAEIELVWIRLIRVKPRLLPVCLAPNGFPLYAGREAKIRLRTVNTGGPLSPSRVKVSLRAVEGMRMADVSPWARDDSAPGERWQRSWAITPTRTGLIRFDARADVENGKDARVVADAPVLPGPDLALPIGDGPLLENGRVAVSFHGGDGGVAWALLHARTNGRWQPCGFLSPLAHIVLDSSDCTTAIDLSFRKVTASKRRVTLVHASPDASVRIETSLTDDGRLVVNTRLRARRRLQLLRFSGPILHVGFGPDGAQKDGAIFPGHEFLEGDAPSSDKSVTGPFLYYRPHPDPRTVTVPVLAVRARDVLVGMMWDPLQDWGRGRGRPPVAEFASPNFLDRQPNHRIGCFVPGSPWRSDPSLPAAETPLTLQPGDRLHLQTQVFVHPDARLIDAVPLWYRTFGLPAHPPPAHSDTDAFDLLMQGYAVSLWHPKERGFTTHLFHHAETPRWVPGFAARVLDYALRTERWERAERIGLTRHDSLLGILGSIFGTVPPPPASIGQQSADGNWPYHEATRHDVAAFSNGFADRLGDEGATYNGYTANKAIPILMHALQWGDEASRESGLRALAALERTRVPCGAQTWEVPARTPDLYAAARIATCFIIGWRLTGDDRCLENARYWLYTGLPFLYAWRLPDEDRPVRALVPGKGELPGDVYYQDPAGHETTPWGSLPVFGTSLYRVSWFGTLVHFCGLVWADAALEYLRYASDPVLEHAARGVVRVGVNLTLDKPPYAGLLPDGFDLIRRRAQGVLIGPMRVEAPLRRLLDLPPPDALHAALVRTPQGGVVRILSRGAIRSAVADPGYIQWRQRYTPGQTCETMLFPAPNPENRSLSVRVGRAPLPRVPDITAVTDGWGLRNEHRRLEIRITHTRDIQTVRVQWTSNGARPDPKSGRTGQGDRLHRTSSKVW